MEGGLRSGSRKATMSAGRLWLVMAAVIICDGTYSTRKKQRKASSRVVQQEIQFLSAY